MLGNIKISILTRMFAEYTTIKILKYIEIYRSDSGSVIICKILSN